MKSKILQVLRECNEEIIEEMDRDLLASGILDSFDIVNMVIELEEAFDIQMQQFFLYLL